MSANSIPKYIEGLNTEGKQYVNEFIDFMNREYPQLKPKIFFPCLCGLPEKDERRICCNLC